MSDRSTHLSAERQAAGAASFPTDGAYIEFTSGEVEQSIPRRFEKVARRFPDRIAVKTGNLALSYQELNEAADRAAARISSDLGEAPEPVAMFLEHGIQAIVGILAILKAGKIFVTLDPSFPRERVVRILEDCGPRLIVTNPANEGAARELSGDAGRLLNLDELKGSTPGGGLRIAVSPDALSHVLYTSGSTGSPKGVMQTHRNMLHEIMAYTNHFRICAEDAMTLLASCGSGQGIKNALCALLNGARLCPLDIKTEGAGALAGHLTREEITVYHSSASLFRHFARTLTGAGQFPRLRLIRLASQQVLKEDFELYKKHFPPDCILVNALSASETGSFRWHFMNKETVIDGSAVPVGYAMEGKQVLLLDEEGREVGIDRAGEIAVRSRYLSPGYWRRPDLTRSKFLPAHGDGEERIYLTGDLGRIAPDGCLFHLGRRDFQVKVRGYRVETEEVERALLEHEAVGEAAVVGRPGPSGDETRVAAYFVASRQPPPAAGDLRRFLAAKLPDYMVPAVFVRLDALPLTPNGKVDRSALPPANGVRPELDSPFVAPVTADEKRMAAIWAEILKLQTVGMRDNFFDLGGHSLSAGQIMSRVREVLGLDLPLRILFENPTVEKMAGATAELRAEKSAIESAVSDIESLSDAEARRRLADGTE